MQRTQGTIERRGRFLDEYERLPDDELFKNAYSKLLNEFEPSSVGRSRIHRVIENELSIDPNVSLRGSGEWWHYQEVLCGSSNYVGIVSDETRADLDSLLESIVFAPAFRWAILSFLNEIQEACDYLKTANFRQIKKKTLIDAFLARVIDISQYALFVNWKQSGKSYSEWCRNFEKTAGQNPWLGLAHEYPVLIRYLAETTSNFSAHLTELLQSLETDRSRICAVFGINSGDHLVEMDSILSDPHHGGRTVVRLHFRSKKTLIYKPKPLEIESYFNEFIRAQSQPTGFVPLTVMNCDGYGWVEDALARKWLKDVSEVDIGRASAWLWLLNATDMHQENLIQSGDGIFGLDLETLLSVNPSDNMETLQDTWRDFSITSTLLYDAALPGSPSEIGYSGFTPQDFVRLPYARVEFSVSEDKIHFKKVTSHERVDAKVDIADQKLDRAEVILDTFSSVAPVLAPIATEFSNGLPDSTQLRVILRPTNFYYQILHRIRQPRFLRNGALTSIELYRLFHSASLFGKQTHKDDVDVIIIDEINQIKAQDIPYFSRTVGSNEIRTKSATVKNYTAVTGREKVLQKLRQIGLADYMEQRALLATALGRPSLGRSTSEGNSFQAHDSPQIQNNQETDRLESLISILMKDIIDTAFVSDRNIPRWICVSGSVDAQSLRAFAGDLNFFSGSLGIILAIQAAASSLSGQCSIDSEQFLVRHASSILDRFERNCDLLELEAGSIGFTGIGGYLFAFSILNKLNNKRWSRASMIIARMMSHAQRMVSDDRWIDVVGGAAGLIIGCEQVIRYGPSHLAKPAKVLITVAADHIVKAAKPFDGNMAWTIPGERVPLLGYAHGWSGIVSALLIAAERSASKVCRKAVHDTLLETMRFPVHTLTDSGTWLDYRGSMDPTTVFQPVNRSWCNGTTGILRGLLNLGSDLPPELSDIVSSLLNQQRFSESEVTRYCCGRVAAIDLLKDCSAIVADAELARLAEETISDTLTKAADALALDLPERFYASLFQGKAGVAYSAMRIINANLPSLSGPALWSGR